MASHELNGRADQRFQHGLQIEGRAADDFQHLGGGGLLLQRLGQIARARLHLVEKPHVLDCDHGLVGEGLDQLDLASAEYAWLRARDDDSTDERLVADEGDAEQGAIACIGRQTRVVFGIGSGVGDVLRLPRQQDSCA